MSPLLYKEQISFLLVYKNLLMRKLLFLFGYLLLANTVFSQTNAQADSLAAYIRIGTIPSFTVYKAPDSSAFTNKDLKKGKPVLLMLFSPDCGHCQHQEHHGGVR